MVYMENSIEEWMEIAGEHACWYAVGTLIEFGRGFGSGFGSGPGSE